MSDGDVYGNSPFRISLQRPILTSHSSPASGRDDEINVSRNVLDDIKLKFEYSKTNGRTYVENEKDWAKLLTLANIETATRNIALSTAIYVTLCAVFLKNVPKNETETLVRLFESLSSTQTFDEQFGNKLEDFIRVSCKQNATFFLHFEIVIHCDEIIEIGIFEKIGGKYGHNLLLAIANVKSLLPFSFSNGASSYAGFCS
ncbi:unnamed protein product [Mytilus coruscus]|uniref:Uncharacterized protein n=1 Tax=Mytilus coruscus TaxID=42192 RepID=A0A6J8EMI6_MYTCO|nr:unnamed protein product [Mytilus coruscus]